MVYMNKKIGITGAILGFTAILLGAFAAHGLKDSLPKDSLEAFKTATNYQMYHALFLVFLSIINTIDYARKKPIFYCTLFGVLFFSGSIYVLSTTSSAAIKSSAFVFITPLGGVLLVLAWVLLLINYIRANQ